MSDDIVERLREYPEEWKIDRSVADRAANEIIRLRALVEASGILSQPGALTVNCVRGTVACQEAERLRARAKEILFGAAAEIERLRARVEALERVREAAQAWREDMTMPTDHARSGVIGRRLINALAEIEP
jgi:hypothetical protein